MQKLDNKLKRDIMRKIARDENDKIEIKMGVPGPYSDRDFLEEHIDTFTSLEENRANE